MRAIFRIVSILFAITALHGGICFASEVPLYDQKGEAVAYVDTNDGATIYTWSGRPVAYLNGSDLFGFNGRHLGWLNQGIIYDHHGDGVGFFKSATTQMTQLESLKGLKQLKPMQSLKEMVPLTPLFSSQWSNTPLSIFLLNGSE